MSESQYERVSGGLRRYQSHKVVHARPMTRIEFAISKGIELPVSDIPGDEDPGYLVVYNKDTPDHYESWCPKDIFEAGNSEIVE